MASAELVWQIVKDNLVLPAGSEGPGPQPNGQMGPHFTTEPNNLAGIRSWRYSGLANTSPSGLARPRAAASPS